MDLHSTRRRPSGGRKRETATSPIQSNDTDPKSQTCGRGEIRHCTEAESYFILHVLRHNTPAVHTHPPMLKVVHGTHSTHQIQYIGTRFEAVISLFTPYVHT